MSERIVLLIHGVGSSEEGAIRQATRSLLDRSELSEVRTGEFHWNSIVETPVRSSLWSGVAQGYFSSLLHGICSSALEASGTGSLPTVIFLLLSIAPLFLLWYASIHILHVAQSLPREWQPLLPTFLIPLLPAIVVGRSAVAHSQEALRIAFLGWLASLAALALIFVLIRAWQGRGALAAALRTVVLASVWQFIAVAAVASRLVIVGLFALPLVAWGILYNFSIVPKNSFDESVEIPSFGDLFINLPHALTSILIAAVIAAALLWFIRFALVPVLKVLADIFRYVGDPEYRERLQFAIERRFQELDLSGRELYIVAHSLGSVIAVDALSRFPNGLRTCSSIMLITLGSPLRRFFWRFFRPAMPAPDDLAADLEHRYPLFRWINVYRPFDPIGARLFAKTGHDFSTKQYHRILAWAHIDYWADEKVLHRAHQAVLAARPHSPGKPAGVLKLFDGVGRRRFSLAAQKIMITLWGVLPVAILCASRLYFDMHFDLVDYTQKVAMIEKNAGQSDVRVWDRPLKTITNAGFFTTWTQYLISYRTASREYSYVIDGDLAGMLKQARRGPVKARYRMDQPATYYLPGYDKPSWPSPAGWIGWIVFCGVLSAAWIALAVNAGPLLASISLGLHKPKVTAPLAVGTPVRKPVAAPRVNQKKLLLAVAASALVVSGAYAAWTRLIVPSQDYQLWRIRSTIDDCLESRRLCSDSGWIPLVAILGQPDRALAASRQVAVDSRVPVLNELRKAGVTVPDDEYEVALDAASRSSRYEVDGGLVRLATVAQQLEDASEAALAKQAWREAADRWKKLSGTPFIALQYASDAGLSREAASVWGEALKIVVTDTPGVGNGETITVTLGSEVALTQPLPSSGRLSAAIRAQYIFDKIPPAADLGPPLKLLNSWHPNYEKLGAMVCLTVGLVKDYRDKEALGLLETLPGYWQRPAVPLPPAVPGGDASRLKADLRYLFRHFANHGAVARLRAIVDRLPADSEVRAAAQAGIADWEASQVREKSRQAVLAHAQALLAAHSYREVRQLAESSQDEGMQWKILALMIRQLKRN